MALTVTRILHAGYQIESPLAKILFDPIVENPFSINCHAFPYVNFNHSTIESEIWDAIFISHIHDDHFSLQSLKHFNRNIPIYIYTTNNDALDLLEQLGFNQIHLLQHQIPVQIQDIYIEAYPALDIDVDCIFHIRSQGYNILNVVDSWIDYETLDKLKKVGSWNLILWPFQTMREIEVLSPTISPKADTHLPTEWIEQIKDLNPECIVPSSCQFQFENDSWINHFYFPITYAQFSKDLKENGVPAKVLRLDPSTSLEMSSGRTRPQSLSWVQLDDNNLIDYIYNPSLKIPHLLDFSLNRFSSLNDDDQFFLIEWLRNMEKLFPTVDVYIDEEGTEHSLEWTLKVYNQGSILWDKAYSSKESKDFVIPWTTEIIAEKLWGALKKGETLSSLYIRINDDISFENLKSLDRLQDPLLKILYSADPLQYQKYQLLNILKLVEY